MDDLPRGTPKGTQVNVRFDYARDGRLTVHASLPEIDRKISMTLDRAAGLSEEQVSLWSKRLDDGMSDAMLVSLPKDDSKPATSNTADQLELPGDHQIPAPMNSRVPDQSTDAPIPMQSRETDDSRVNIDRVGETKAAFNSVSDSFLAPTELLSSVTASTTPDAEDDTAAPQEIELHLGDPSPADAPKISADDFKLLPGSESHGAQAINEKPSIDVGKLDPQVKADAGDLATLAAIAGETSDEKPSRMDVPLIVTDRSLEKGIGRSPEKVRILRTQEKVRMLASEGGNPVRGTDERARVELTIVLHCFEPISTKEIVARGLFN